MLNYDISKLSTPCYVIDEKLLIKNLEKLHSIEKKTGCKILLAQKAFSMYSTYPLIGKYLTGAASSGLFEARLSFEEMHKETHVYSPAYKTSEFDDIMKYSDHIVFNSFSQLKKFKEKVKANEKKISIGLRINPEYSEIETDIYNPCFENSRLGTTLSNFDESMIDEIDGLHFHTMCEQNSDTLMRTIKIVDEEFGKYISKMKWINFGGGHHITKEDYDVDTLIEAIMFIKNKYNIDVYLEPGEAVALNCGFLVSEVLETAENGMKLAIMDTSAACHMPDVLEMPYRPNIIGSGKPEEKPFTYRLGGPTCLAGDIIGDYSFDKPLIEGDKLIFCDMAIYSMVKNNTFNGMPLPSIILIKENGEKETVKKFSYQDFKMRI